MYKGIIFDLDGTLMDTIEDIGDSMNRVLEEYGLEKYSYENYKLKVGSGFEKLVLRSMGDNIDQETYREALLKLRNYYDENFKNKSKPYKGIMELLEELKTSRIKLGVNTNKDQKYAEELLSSRFKNIEFISIIGNSENIDIKPSPMAANIIVNKMQLKPNEVLYVGDSDVDMKTGQAAGLDTVGVCWGFRSEKELRKNNAKYIINHPNEIIKIIGEAN